MSSQIIDKYNVFSLSKCLNRLMILAQEGDHSKLVKENYYTLFDIYDEIERIVSNHDFHEFQSIFSDGKIISSLPYLYRLRSAFEYYEEWKLATDVLTSSEPTTTLRKEIDKKLSNLPESFLSLINGFEKIIFAGSGPLPKTALAFAQYSTDKEILCLDYCDKANEIARHYVELSGIKADISFVTTDIMEFDRFDEYDVVVGAFLLGVDDKIAQHGDKSSFVNNLVELLGDDTDLILRIPQGLGTLIYPAVLPDILSREHVDCYPQKSEKHSYNSYFFHMKNRLIGSNKKLAIGA